MLYAILIFIIVYILIATEKVDKTIAALAGVFLMFIFNIIPFRNAVAAVDLNVIFLLVGMMTCVFVLSRTGFFEWIAISIAKYAKGNPFFIMLLFVSITAVFSAFLDNVTTIILLSPITILVMEILEITPVPILILEVLASNIGGTATLIGDPPNILIGSQAGLTFNDFLLNLSPVVLLIFSVFLGTIFLLFRKKWQVKESVKLRVTEALPHLAIIDKKNMIRALWVLVIIFLGFFTHNITKLEPGMIALAGGILMIVACRSKIDVVFAHVEWGLIFFFIGLFMLVSGLEYTGAIAKLAEGMLHIGGTNVFMLCIVILGGSALISSLLDNIPFVITMIPLVKQLILKLSTYSEISDASLIHIQIAQPLWWSLALGACLGGNGTLIGASANLVMAKISERNNYTISFKKFFKYGFPFMLQSIVISGFYIWLKYFSK